MIVVLVIADVVDVVHAEEVVVVCNDIVVAVVAIVVAVVVIAGPGAESPVVIDPKILNFLELIE